MSNKFSHFIVIVSSITEFIYNNDKLSIDIVGGWNCLDHMVLKNISKHLFRFAIQLIITSTNRYYSVVCISVYGKISSFFVKYFTKTFNLSISLPSTVGIAFSGLSSFF